MNVTRGNLPDVAGWGEQVFRGMPFVESGWADISNGELPGIDHLAVEGAVWPGGGDLEHDRPFLQVGIATDIRRTAVACHHFEVRAGGFGVGEDGVVLCAELIECPVAHTVNDHCGYRP